MAARKSCTHLTWAQAKNKSGISTSKSKTTKAKGESHGQHLAAKILNKYGPDDNEKIKNRQAAKQARKDHERALRSEQQRKEAQELARRSEVVRPWEQALEKLRETAEKLEQTPQNPAETVKPSLDQYETVCLSKQMQFDEWVALQAMYHGEDILRLVQGSCDPLRLEATLNQWQNDTGNQQIMKEIVELDVLSFTLALTLEGDDQPLSLCLLLSVTFPPLYPGEVAPNISISYFFATDQSLAVPSNKPLVSMGRLRQDALLEAIRGFLSTELLGIPSVYEVASTWLPEHIWEYLVQETYG